MKANGMRNFTVRSHESELERVQTIAKSFYGGELSAGGGHPIYGDLHALQSQLVEANAPQAHRHRESLGGMKQIENDEPRAGLRQPADLTSDSSPDRY